MNHEDSAALAESMRVLRTHSNSRVPISHLPDEILLTIFKYYEEETRLNGYESDDEEYEGDYIDDVPACLDVTHVCRRWRKVALECPTLWKFINSTPAPWLDVMLERSQKVPLVVTYSASSVSTEDCLEKVLLHLPRIKYLDLQAYPHHTDRVMNLLSSKPALMLETFKFSVHCTPTVSISDTIFQGQAPSLRYLEVYHCGWTSWSFGGIRTLFVHSMQLPDLLTALQCMPSLEQLRLLSELRQSDRPILINKVPLPRLKNIALEEISLQDAVSLFSHLALPVDIKIALRLSIKGPHTFADLLSVMPNGSGPVFRSLRAFKPTPWSFAVQFSTATVINSRYSWNPQDDDIRLSIEFYDEFLDPSAEIPRGLIFDVFKFVAQRGRQTFFSEEFEFISVLDCLDLTEGLTAALRIDGPSDIPYPSLKALELLGVWFEEDAVQDLLDVLTMRVQHNVPVYNLCLRDCHLITAAQMQLFREVVQNVKDIDCETHLFFEV